MVLERIIGKSLLTNQPDVALFLGFIFTLIGFATSYIIFFSGMSVAMIGFSSLLILPYIVKIMKPESSQYHSIFDKKNPSLMFFCYLFLGMALAYTILFGILNPNIGASAFDMQLEIIDARFSKVLTGMFGMTDFFYQIISNNIILLAVIIILSYFYGTGAIFILNYNASIAGIVYGSWINALIWGGYVEIFAFPRILLFLPHTVIEILAYLLAAIAGIIISKPITKRNINLIKRDGFILIIAAVALIIIGGMVEVTVPFMI